MENVGQRIKKVRKEKHISAETIAERLNVAPASVYRWENGSINKVPTGRLVQIAEVLNVTPSYLLGWDHEKQSLPQSADLDDDDALLTYQGNPISKEDREIIKRLLKNK